MFTLLVLHACVARLDLPPPADLPERVFVSSATEAFTSDWYVALRAGRIWVKPIEESGRAPGEWTLLGRTGLPEGPHLDRFEPPSRVEEISADGCHLHAVSSDGIFYRGTDLRRQGLSSFSWTDRWGWPAANGKGLKIEFPTIRGWAVSDSHPFDVDHYEDILGIEHPVGLGVAHVYRLSPDGRQIHFNDWWLPADWSRRVCGPQRGSFQARSIAASASTLFLLGVDGAMYTRLYDFDTAGENDLLTYSYVLDGPSGSTRALPAEPWQRQPDIPRGRLTDRIAIFQDGEGNRARVLRVEAELDGAAGYFEKRLDEERWSFHETGSPLVGRFLEGLREESASEPPSPPDSFLQGRLCRDDLRESLTLELLDFNLFCSPARARLRVGGELVTVGGVPLELQLHHVHRLVKQVRPIRYWEQGQAAQVRAALLLPDDLSGVDAAEARAALHGLLGRRQVINFWGEAWPDALALEEIPRAARWQVPRREKGKRGELFRLEVRAADPDADGPD